MILNHVFDLAAAAPLFAACVAAWHLSADLKMPARLPLRFAAMLLASLAVATVVRLGEGAALLLLPLAAPALALVALARFARPLGSFFASLALVAGLGCGMTALLTMALLPAVIAVLLSGILVIAASLNRMAWMAMLSGAALLLAGLAMARTGVSPAVLLACAATVIGLSKSRAEAQAQPQLLRSTSSAVFSARRRAASP